MARYVLIAFEDDNAAEEFVAAAPVPGGVFIMGTDTHFKNLPEVTIRGMWQKPTLLCECPPGPKRDYARSTKRGWYICRQCTRTHPGWARGEHLYQSFGTNLLPVSATAPEWRGSGVAGHVWDEGSKNWVHAVTGEPFNAQKAFRERKDYHR